MDIHYIQNSILMELARSPGKKFGEFKITGQLNIESDSFNYHLRTLVKQKYVTKTGEGKYLLSLKGKEYVSKMDFINNQVERTPKLSVMVRIYNNEDPGLVLIAKRRKHPFLGQLGLITGKIKFGEETGDAVVREVEEETALAVKEWNMVGMHRWIDYDKSEEQIVHDAMFIVCDVTRYSGKLSEVTDECENSWMELSELKGREDLLPSLEKMVNEEVFNRIEIEFSERRIVTEGF